MFNTKKCLHVVYVSRDSYDTEQSVYQSAFIYRKKNTYFFICEVRIEP